MVRSTPLFLGPIVWAALGSDMRGGCILEPGFLDAVLATWGDG